jgi:hypothetical protein
MNDTTPNLLPCPFCGSTRVSIDDTVAGAFVSCDLCEAQGPFVEYQQVNYPASMLRSISVAPNGDAINPPVTVVGQSNEEYKELREKATREAQSAAIAAWNQRSPWQPIETAPRDGTDFIAYNEFTGPYITAAKSISPIAAPPDGTIRFSMHHWHGQKGTWFPEPTHWQPLPSPPITPIPHD